MMGARHARATFFNDYDRDYTTPTDVKLYDYASFNNFWFRDVDV
jgi:hypothetical protein